MKKMTITVETTIKASIEKVWEFWTEPKHIINWNFASDEWCCPTATNDLQKDGNFVWRMEAKDGSMGFDFTGTYINIINNEFISYRMTDGRIVEIKFTKEGDEVQLSETFEAEGTNSDEQQRAGWQAILGNFKRYVESS
ncbi:SRPBCC family protein [Algibacter sp. 2305UL17-15]|uniref:SRPBCC family protein n=1 Tax=Algibacter sp. 2305UL17-15 TaxID=3231268 RepID=UPI003458D9CA